MVLMYAVRELRILKKSLSSLRIKEIAELLGNCREQNV